MKEMIWEAHISKTYQMVCTHYDDVCMHFSICMRITILRRRIDASTRGDHHTIKKNRVFLKSIFIMVDRYLKIYSTKF